MKTLNYVNLVLLFVLCFGFTSCGDDVYYTAEENSTEKLCSKEWMEQYIEDNMLHQHILLFTADGRGKDKLIRYKKLANGQWSDEYYSEKNDNFTWKWMDNDMEALQIDFWGEKMVMFHNVRLRQHYLSGNLDGEDVMFIDKNYY